MPITKTAIVRTVALVCLLAPLFAGCASREHMRPDHGQRNRAYFARQQVYPTAAAERPQGLDSEESSIIYSNYRENLRGEGAAQEKETPSRVLLVEESDKK